MARNRQQSGEYEGIFGLSRSHIHTRTHIHTHTLPGTKTENLLASVALSPPEKKRNTNFSSTSDDSPTGVDSHTAQSPSVCLSCWVSNKDTSMSVTQSQCLCSPRDRDTETVSDQMAAGTVQRFTPVQSDNYLFLLFLPPSLSLSFYFSLSLSPSLFFTKGYSHSHRLQGTLNQTTRSPTNHNAAAG